MSGVMGSVARMEGGDTPQGAARPKVIAFATDTATESLLSECIAELCPVGAEVRRMNCGQARAYLEKNLTPHILVIDVGGEEYAMQALEELANVVEPDVLVLVVGDRSDAAFYRMITRDLGAMEYLHRPLNRNMIMRFFGPYMVDGTFQPESVRGGRVITVTGTRGGVGASTILGNLAWFLAEQAGRHTLAVDRDIYTGTLGLLLGAHGNDGLRAGLEAPERLDHLFIERSAQMVGKRLALLSSLTGLREPTTIGASAVRHLLDVVTRRYNFILAEVPVIADAAAIEFLASSHQQILVVDPTLPSVRDALRVEALPRAKNQHTRPLIVANAVGRPGTLSRQDFEKGLGRKPDIVIPFLPRQLGQAEIDGIPAAKARGAFQTAIVSLAQEATSVQSTVAGARPKRGFRGFFRAWTK